MTPDRSFGEWMDRLRAGDDEAAREVFHRYSAQLIALARRHLDARLRAKVDPEDVVQSAYKSFFHRYGEGKLDVGSWKSLWGLLTLITLRKCVDRVEYHHAERRDLRREAGAGPGAEGGQPWWEAVGREPTPVEAVILAETVEQLFRTVTADERAVLELSLQGYTAPEISQQLGRAERSVRRLRERIRKHLEGLHQEGLRGA